jgi:superfamily I DNA and/or RNA helicase/very-short-patch-repair endonuclease
LNSISLEAEIAPIYSLAFNQNHIPLIQRLQLSSKTQENEEQDLSNCVDIKVVFASDSDIFSSETWLVDSLLPGHTLTLQIKNIRVSTDFLSSLSEQLRIGLNFKIYVKDKLVNEIDFETEICPKNYWGGEANMSELLAAFVTPNTRYVEKLAKKASGLLLKSEQGSQLDGYQSETRERPYLIASAIWNVICAESISYVSPPASFATSGQRIRLPDDIEVSSASACLDLSTLFASCMEHVGLNPIIAVTEGHACAGVWLIDDCFGLLTNDDPMDIRKRVAAKDLILFETTLATSDHHITFGQAQERALSLIDEDSEDKFVFAIDITQGRKRKIKPLPTIKDVNEKPDDIEEHIGPELVSAIPPLPPVRKEELQPDDTPEGRVGMWQRKLLDLTKRNRLLNLSARSVAVKLFCPDVARLEDLLAEGNIFHLITPAKTPYCDSSRDKEVFRFTTGDDLQNEFAKEQLDCKVVIANESEKKLEKNLLSLYRKAKNDLEEGGANTLFLSIGMLKWKEFPESSTAYKAPLVLLPVDLIRSSARSKIRIKQRLEDETIFNSTLIEFLQNDFEIDLTALGKELPTDKSGVDIPLVFEIIRNKIKDVTGFELVEELVVSTFSFAKYLMWRDLSDRVDDLKSNLFVSHLIESPNLPYSQDSEFLEQATLDSKLKPSDIFAPLNADSSQLVAIDASTKPQDFVLEGPPGTGKSETIANIIAHNIASGRKVLFVAEKMAALNVVYRRLEKVGLDHLCLELHSNKANKRAVLDQLKNSWMTRKESDQKGWEDNAEKLFEVRNALNNYVNEVHKPSVYGLSVRNAISRISRYGNAVRLRLDWENSISQSPVKNIQQLNHLYDAAKQIGLAFSDVSRFDFASLDIVNQTQWTNAWQREMLGKTKLLLSQTEAQQTNYVRLSEQLKCLNNSLTIEGLDHIYRLAKSIVSTIDNSVNFIYRTDAKDQLQKLSDLIGNKMNLDLAIPKSKLNPDISKIGNYQIDDWLNRLRLSDKQFIIIGWFTKRKIQKEVLLAGLNGDVTIDELEHLVAIRNLASSIQVVKSLFEEDSIWKGWDTSPNSLQNRYDIAKEHFDITRLLAGNEEDPVGLLSSLKSATVDGREFLTTDSKLIRGLQSFISLFDTSKGQFESFTSLGGKISEASTLENFTAELKYLTENEAKLNAWCRWNEMKDKASSFEVESLVDALQNETVLPEECVEHLKTAFCQWLAPILIDDSEVLRSFRTTNQESLINEFRELDTLVASATSDYISALVASKTPDPNSPDSPEGYGVLAREFNRKSNHKPTRILIEEMGENLLQLTPCMMMSPLSVAQFLPADFTGFDLVVFDEASQITVWDAVGSIARGKNVIVVGDPKQMPPTNFFNKSSSDDMSDEEDLESILDQALAARLPHHRLTGHYRSKHESLIAFSNSHYYANSLVTFPSAVTKNSAVVFHKVDGLYSKGKGRNNIIEANRVTDFIVERLKNKSLNKLTMGVVTLNTEQQRCIEDSLDDKRRQYPEIETFFNSTDTYDGIFVKNLESVQGDERDIIIFSLGYGPTEPKAKTMSMNFGPLNKEGGERRLNVAVTRATTEMHVFSSFGASMIDLSRTSSIAIRHLKSFLEYAEKGPIALAEKTIEESGVDQFDSDFEHAVAFALREKGWQVQTQVGVSKFRIDLGIIHPERPGEYLAGIECDGATYHSSPSARDRDRVRQIILESLGWNLLRIWSTDYFVDSETVIEKAHEQLNLLLEKSKETAEELIDEIIEPLVEEEFEFDAKRYFNDDYKNVLEKLAIEILESKSGITLNELASDIGWRHDFGRTTKKQLDHLESIIAGWAGIKKHENGSKTVWLSPDDIKHLVEWRGVAAFGLPREWSSLAYPEQLGIAKYALSKSTEEPVEVIFEEFGLSRRTANTRKEYQVWIDNYRMEIENQ